MRGLLTPIGKSKFILVDHLQLTFPHIPHTGIQKPIQKGSHFPDFFSICLQLDGVLSWNTEYRLQCKLTIVTVVGLSRGSGLVQVSRHASLCRVSGCRVRRRSITLKGGNIITRLTVVSTCCQMKKNATWRWQWALPVIATTPCLLKWSTVQSLFNPFVCSELS